jgi:hypothetical protein
MKPPFMVTALLLAAGIMLAQNTPAAGPTNPSGPVGQPPTTSNPANPQDYPAPNAQDRSGPSAANPQDRRAR